MKDQKLNYIIFFVLSFLIILVSSRFFKTEQKPQPPAMEEMQPAATPFKPTAQPIQSPEGAMLPPVAEDVVAPHSKTIKVRTSLFLGEIDTIGGRLVSWEILDYNSTTAPGSPPINVLHDTQGIFSTKVLLSGISIPNPIPFTYDGPDEIVFNTEKDMIVLSWDSGQGVVIKKTYTIDPTSYLLESKVEIINNTNTKLREIVMIESNAKMVHEDKTENVRSFIAFIGDDVEREDDTPDEIESYKGTTSWFGFSDKYFMSVFLPEVGAETKLEFIPVDQKEKLVMSLFAYPEDVVPAAQTSVKTALIYLGPKSYESLRNYGLGLEEAIQYGWIGFLARPMLRALKITDSWFNNYGISIIIITLLIRIVFLPLTIKGMSSMKVMQTKMQAIKPEIDEMKEKYAKDKAKQNQELMQIYSKHGINPLSSLGGCLPMLVQIPIFIALYEVLLYSIELRHSPFLWINDLAEPEHLFDIPGIGIPFRILPLLMGVSWYASQKLTPTAAPGSDNMQMKMMEYMPIIFTVMFWGLPSGLILYWTVSNLLSIVQQLYVNKRVAAKGRA